MTTQEKIEIMLKKSEVILNAGKNSKCFADEIEFLKHPYTCAITGLEVDKPCWECTIYKQLDSNCEYRPKQAYVHYVKK